MTRARVLFSMAKSNSGARKSKTHFEQVPLEVVRKIADQGAPRDKKAGTVRAGAQPASKKKDRGSYAP